MYDWLQYLLGWVLNGKELNTFKIAQSEQYITLGYLSQSLSFSLYLTLGRSMIYTVKAYCV